MTKPPKNHPWRKIGNTEALGVWKKKKAKIAHARSVMDTLIKACGSDLRYDHKATMKANKAQ